MTQPITTTEHVGNGWTRVMSQTVALLPRPGWAGVWDAFVAAILRRPVKTVPTDLVCSVYVKPRDDGADFWHMAVEQSAAREAKG